MCGIAGVVDLAGQRPIAPATVRSMADALVHRGPDGSGFLEQPGLALASRRLSIVGLDDGWQPLTNEDQGVFVVFNGELFDYPERRAELEARGHRFRTHCDTELIPHLWEEYHEGLFEHLHGQFAFALWDQRRQQVILARDRFGICPLYWARQDGWLLFASEIKALLATGLITPRPDPRGLDQVFTFFALPGPATCFAGIANLLPGHYLDVRLAPGTGAKGRPATVREHTYWEIDFPDWGDEDPGRNPQRLLDEFEAVLSGAVAERLRADVPVVSYLSGGVDSSLVVALARHIRGKSIPTFTIQVQAPGLDETEAAQRIGRELDTEPVVTRCGQREILAAYPDLIDAAEAPVIDTSCATLLRQAQAVRAHGYKVALTGEGADEWLAGYPWYKVTPLLRLLDAFPGRWFSRMGRRHFLYWLSTPQFRWRQLQRMERAAGDFPIWLDVYALMSIAKSRLYSQQMNDVLADYVPLEDLQLNRDRLRRWHPLNRGLYLGARVMLPGLLLQAKGDRVAMHSSVETRYPFLDEDVFAFLARLHPRWKLHGFREKYLLRRLAERWLPSDVAWRRKVIFRAPFPSLFDEPAPGFIDDLLSEDSLRKTGYFDPAAVHYWRRAALTPAAGPVQQQFIQMSLAGVVATQLWHHRFIDSSLTGKLETRNSKSEVGVRC
jgi:asparagine synthase (glutamine-hydrolysing)